MDKVTLDLWIIIIFCPFLILWILALISHFSVMTILGLLLLSPLTHVHCKEP